MWSLGIAAACELLKELIAVYRDKTDPVKNKQRILLELKKQLIYQEKEQLRAENRLKKALTGLDKTDNAVQIWTTYRNECVKEIKRLKQRIKLFEKQYKEINNE